MLHKSVKTFHFVIFLFIYKYAGLKHTVAKYNLELLIPPPASTFWMLGLQVCPIMLSLEYREQNSGLFRSLKMGGRPLWTWTVAVFRWCFGVIVFLVTENSICIKAVRMTDVCPSSDFISYQMKATVLLHTILCACECAEVPYCRRSPKQRFTCKQLSLTKKKLERNRNTIIKSVQISHPLWWRTSCLHVFRILLS